MDKKIVGGIVIGCFVLVGAMALLLGKPTGSTPAAGGTSSGQVVVKVRGSDWVRGNVNAPVTLFEYSDFQCPACKAYVPIVKRLLDEYPDKVKEVYRYFPLLSIHVNSMASAKAAEAAGKQGKFWEMGDLLFSKQLDWAENGKAAAIFEGYAKDLGLDVNKFKQDVANADTEKRVNVDLDDAGQLNLSGTPTFFLNGKTMDLPGSYENFKALIDKELATVTVSPAPSTTSAAVTTTPPVK